MQEAWKVTEQEIEEILGEDFLNTKFPDVVAEAIKNGCPLISEAGVRLQPRKGQDTHQN